MTPGEDRPAYEAHARRKGFFPGARFGVLEVVQAPRLMKITVRCDCGAENVVTARHLRLQPKRCQQCPPPPRVPQPRKVDLTGLVFGGWTVLGPSSKGTPWWDVQCKCGKLATRTGRYLRRKRSQCQTCWTADLNVEGKASALADGFVPGANFGVLTIVEVFKRTEITALCVCGAAVTTTTAALARIPQRCSHDCGLPSCKDWSGHIFGQITVLSYVDGRYWRCRCSCGTIKHIHISNLRQGRTQSCGCRLPSGLRRHYASNG